MSDPEIRKFSSFYKFKMWVDEHFEDPEVREQWLQRWTTEHWDPDAPRKSRWMFDPTWPEGPFMRLLCVGGDFAVEARDAAEGIKALNEHGLCEFDDRHYGTYFETVSGGALLQMYRDPKELR
jgi:hypothetical protein